MKKSLILIAFLVACNKPKSAVTVPTNISGCEYEKKYTLSATMIEDSGAVRVYKDTVVFHQNNSITETVYGKEYSYFVVVTDSLYTQPPPRSGMGLFSLFTCKGVIMGKNRTFTAVKMSGYISVSGTFN